MSDDNDNAAVLVKLDDSDWQLADPRDDVRGTTVLDNEQNEVGEVDGLLIDEGERRVRFLRVASGGFLGIGAKKWLIPVDAVVDVDDTVHIDASRDRVAGSVEYDPELSPERAYYAGLYEYYDHPPFWDPDYSYPGFPFGAVSPPPYGRYGGDHRR